MSKPELEFYILNSQPIRHLRKRDKALDEQIDTFQSEHGAELTELCLTLIHGLRYLNMEDRLRVGLSMAAEVLDRNAAQTRTRDARDRAGRRHIENHAMRADVFGWLDENFAPPMTLDDAAVKMAGNLVPLKFRAVRDHCTAWNKLRRAGRP